MATDMKTISADDLAAGDAANVRIWLLQYGPCWCRSIPSDSSSFDYVRLRRTSADLGSLETNLLIVSARVIDGSSRAYRQVYDEMPDPKIVISAAVCPFAHSFWDGLPNGWAPVEDLLPIDVYVDECINGEPEALMAAVLAHVFAIDGSSEGSDRGAQVSHSLERAATDA